MRGEWAASLSAAGHDVLPLLIVLVALWAFCMAAYAIERVAHRLDIGTWGWRCDGHCTCHGKRSG
jgi:hypothetical protein